MLRQNIKSLIILFISTLILRQNECKFQRVCYLAIDSQEVDINLVVHKNLCTHIILGFAGIRNGTISPNHHDDVNYYHNITKLKRSFTDLKVMISVGGGGYDGNGLHYICSNQTNIDKFVNSVMDLLLKYDFDGLDIDWEFPSWNTSFPEDKENFNILLKSLSNQFSRQENRIENRRKLVLSCAVSATINIIDRAYNVSEMALYVDFINIMAYDFHVYSKYWPFTGFNAPLFGRKSERSYFTFLNTNKSVHYWVELGMSRDKIMVGIPTYGRVYQLADPKYTGPDSAALGELGDVSYGDVCQLMKNSSSKVFFDDESKVPYLVNGDHWITYDDPTSVAFKAEWIRENGFAGAMTFDLNSDDYLGVCYNSSKFVLHSIIYSILS